MFYEIKRSIHPITNKIKYIIVMFVVYHVLRLTIWNTKSKSLELLTCNVTIRFQNWKIIRSIRVPVTFTISINRQRILHTTDNFNVIVFENILNSRKPDWVKRSHRSSAVAFLHVFGSLQRQLQFYWELKKFV